MVVVVMAMMITTTVADVYIVLTQCFWEILSVLRILT